MENANEFLAEKKKEYTEKLTPLFNYIPYFTSKEGAKVRSTYTGENNDLKSVPVPVYDGTVLAFIKAYQASGLVDRNYMYALGRLYSASPKDERLFISDTTFRDVDTIVAIMTKYVLNGMTKGAVWSVAVEEGIWLHCLLKLKDLLEIYDRPLA